MDIDTAFDLVKRRDFLPQDLRARADEDRPLPIGYGQTNSQPTTVKRMLKWLAVSPGQKVLDIGSGSGWTTALLARIVGDTHTVYAVEVVPELVDMGRENCANAGIYNVKFYQAGQGFGLPENAPYDRILVSASSASMPSELIDQLATPGRMVIPVGDTIYEVSKDDDGTITETPHWGYVFVPLLPGAVSE